MCLAANRTMAATDADHVVPHHFDYDAFWYGELQSLCHSHHAAKTAAEEGAWGR